MVDCKPIQIQKGGNDCGLFAISNLLSICYNKDPSNINYNQSLMRHHFNQSILSENFDIFPHTESIRRNNMSKTKFFDCVKKKFNK